MKSKVIHTTSMPLSKSWVVRTWCGRFVRSGQAFYIASRSEKFNVTCRACLKVIATAKRLGRWPWNDESRMRFPNVSISDVAVYECEKS